MNSIMNLPISVLSIKNPILQHNEIYKNNINYVGEFLLEKENQNGIVSINNKHSVMWDSKTNAWRSIEIEAVWLRSFFEDRKSS